jgi:hypothetical protein
MFLRVELRVFSHATEDEGKVKAALGLATGGAEPDEYKTEGHHGNPIVIYTVQLTTPRDIRAFWARLQEHRQVKLILEELDRRMDDDLLVHFRLDKQEAYGGRLKVVDHDDVIAVKAKVGAYPAKRERGLEAARSFLAEVMGR